MTAGIRLVSVAVGALIATGCAGSAGPDTARSSPSGGATGEITVSAAASLTEAFSAIGTDFTRAQPNATVTFNFGPSGTLATQIEQGAPADTFAAADATSMDELVATHLIEGAPVTFARNRLVIVTEPGNPKGVTGLADLASLDVVALCGDSAPCGTYAAQVLRRSGTTIPESNVTRGQDVKATLAAVTTGDADAAIVYVTDAKSAPVESVPIADADNAIATYRIATLKASGHRATSRAFIDHVMSPAGQETLRSFGFLPPQ